MGIADIEGVAQGPTGKEETVRFHVDGGATYSLLPKSAWEAIGLTPKGELTFTLADGSTLIRRVSECYVLFPQGEGHTPAILGEPGDEAFLGVVNLEILGAVLNPFNRTLQPKRMLPI